MIQQKTQITKHYTVMLWAALGSESPQSAVRGGSLEAECHG